jgi:hypothetical protein
MKNGSPTRIALGMNTVLQDLARRGADSLGLVKIMLGICSTMRDKFHDGADSVKRKNYFNA